MHAVVVPKDQAKFLELGSIVGSFRGWSHKKDLEGQGEAEEQTEIVGTREGDEPGASQKQHAGELAEESLLGELTREYHVNKAFQSLVVSSSRFKAVTEQSPGYLEQAFAKESIPTGQSSVIRLLGVAEGKVLCSANAREGFKLITLDLHETLKERQVDTY